MHAYTHTYTYTQAYTHTHTHTPTHPPTYPPLHTYTDTHKVQNLQGVSWADMSSIGKNVVNITQENVVLFRQMARKLYTEGDVRGFRGAFGPLV